MKAMSVFGLLHRLWYERKMLLVLATSTALIVLAGCGGRATPTPTLAPRPTKPPRTPTPVPANDEEAIHQLLAAEGEAVVAEDIERLREIWAPDGVVTDAKHTPDDPSDDTTWRGWDAIRERYVKVVFPGNPEKAGARDIVLSFQGSTAVVTSTTVIGNEVSPGGDRWTFAKRDGRWVITSLTYNLELE